MPCQPIIKAVPNPNPKTDHLEPAARKGAESMKGRLFVRVTEEVESEVRRIPNYADWLRELIVEGLKTRSNL